eukprot:scaffold63_cov306-Pinguiococcus_pyrenoidosus.AAC.6
MRTVLIESTIGTLDKFLTHVTKSHYVIQFATLSYHVAAPKQWRRSQRERERRQESHSRSAK